MNRFNVPARERGTTPRKGRGDAVHEYETVFILDPGLDENQVNEEVEKTSNADPPHGGTIIDVQRWGRKRLAYEINKKRDGVYTLIKHESTGETVKELERRLRLNDSVMRVMTVIAGPEWESRGQRSAASPARHHPRRAGPRR
jgi:small subunit ribosomal protein S6